VCKLQTRTCVAMCILILSLSAEADDYISEDDLLEEVINRKADIARTKSRIEVLKNQETNGLQELESLKTEAHRVEQIVIARTRLFYRLHRNGGSLRYLLGASSATALLRRLGELKNLMRSGLETRRQSGMRLAQAESKLQSIRDQRNNAIAMLSMLQQTLDELLKQQVIHGTSKPKMAIR
jgi:hypothetical protein